MLDSSVEFPQYKPLKESAKFLFEQVKDQHQGGAIIDVGANVGAFVDVVLGGFPNASIVGFEPVKKYYVHLVEKYLKFKNVRLYNLALSDVNESKKIYISNSNIGWNTFVTEMIDGTMQDSKDVQCLSLDSFPYNLDNIDLIKIDVEGYEWKVLNGMKQILERDHPTILCEVGWGCNHPHWDEELKAFEYLYSIGYSRETEQMIKNLKGTADVVFKV